VSTGYRVIQPGTECYIFVLSCVQSAVEILRENGVEHMFDVIVCGWSRVTRKTEHISKVVEAIGWRQTVDGPRLYFFDDIVENVEDVRRMLSLAYCVRVFSVDVLPMLVAHCLQLDGRRVHTLTPASPVLTAQSPPHTPISAHNMSPHLSPHMSPISPHKSLRSVLGTPQTTTAALFSPYSGGPPESSLLSALDTPPRRPAPGVVDLLADRLYGVSLSRPMLSGSSLTQAYDGR